MTLIPNSSLLISGEVIPSNMNVIGDGNNQFARLLDSMPAKRVGRMEDVAGTVLYLCSQAGVSRAMLSTFHEVQRLTTYIRATLTEGAFASMEVEHFSRMVNDAIS